MTSPILTDPFLVLPAVNPLRQIKGLFLRHLFLILGSYPRLIEIFFWPLLEIFVWGNFNNYLQQQGGQQGTMLAFFVPAVILWNVQVRTSLAMLTHFLEELWSRNLGHLFASPLAAMTYVSGLMLFSTLRMLIAIGVCTLVAVITFRVNLYTVGPHLMIYILILTINGWWIGLGLISLLLHFGQSVEWLAWFVSFLLLPVVAVYYPVTVLPAWLQHIASFLPPTYVFESLRAVLRNQPFDWSMMEKALLLNCVYLPIGFLLFCHALNRARTVGTLLNSGE